MKATLIVASDTHGRNDVLQQLENAYPTADVFIHCGDLEDDANRFGHWVFVRGNNDWDYNMPSQRILNIAGVRIYVSHSHRCGYSNREQQLIKIAKENGCSVAVFGHTHIPMAKEVHGVWLINPGSMAWPRDGNSPAYAVVHLEDGTVHDVEIIHEESWPFGIKKKERKKRTFWF
ncbi:metallophosphoesterase [Erysipelotrichaceae bacterium RD49]|nr:metallophosphoesterase [Erysipelotrichaceae bacterium RD49]